MQINSWLTALFLVSSASAIRFRHRIAENSVSAEEISSNPFDKELFDQEKIIRDKLIASFMTQDAFKLYKMAFEVQPMQEAPNPRLDNEAAILAFKEFCEFYKPKNPIHVRLPIEAGEYFGCKIVSADYQSLNLEEDEEFSVANLKDKIKSETIKQLSTEGITWVTKLANFLKSKENQLEVVSIDDLDIFSSRSLMKKVPFYKYYFNSVLKSNNFKPKYLMFWSEDGDFTVDVLKTTHQKIKSLEIFVQKKKHVPKFYDLISKSSITELHLSYIFGQDLEDEDWAANHEGIKNALATKTNQITELRFKYGFPASTFAEMLMHPNNKLKTLMIAMLIFSGDGDEDATKFFEALKHPNNKLKVLSFLTNTIFDEQERVKIDRIAREKNMVIEYLMSGHRFIHAGLSSSNAESTSTNE